MSADMDVREAFDSGFKARIQKGWNKATDASMDAIGNTPLGYRTGCVAVQSTGRKVVSIGTNQGEDI